MEQLRILMHIFMTQVLFREDSTADDLIDVINANRIYMPCLYVYNKIDQVSIEEVDRLARLPNSVVVRYTLHILYLHLQLFMLKQE
jgi:ribosome-interacting GTPase 1